MALQQSHTDVSFESKTFPLILLCDGVTGPANFGGLFRLADAFGVEKIIFSNTDFDSSSPRLKRTARNTLEKTPFEIVDDTQEILNLYKYQAYTILSLEITTESIPVQDYNTKLEKCVLVIGSERNGVSEAVLNTSDAHLHIPMFGENSSMNVTQATGIALHELTKLL